MFFFSLFYLENVTLCISVQFFKISLLIRSLERNLQRQTGKVTRLMGPKDIGTISTFPFTKLYFEKKLLFLSFCRFPAILYTKMSVNESNNISWSLNL